MEARGVENNIEARKGQLDKGIRSSHGLGQAIECANAARLRSILKLLVLHVRPARIFAEEFMLVRTKDVVPYHVDSASEDASQSEESELEESEESEEEAEGDEESEATEPAAGGKRKRDEDEETVARYRTCTNCKDEFDVTENERGDCVWHSGYKSVDNDADFWADHDENCHGLMDSFDEDPDFAEGFVWDCCEQRGDADGCKRTKHRYSGQPTKKAKH